MTKQYPQFEATKVALKQDKTGYVLTLSIHPDDLDEAILRDFVGARYQVVMVRLDGHEEPMDRQREYEGDRSIRIAGLLCRDPKFWEYLYEDNQILESKEKEATDWLRDYLNIPSRSELKTNPQARILLDKIHKEYNAWTQKS
jgi:hypothetical protein